MAMSILAAGAAAAPSCQNLTSVVAGMHCRLPWATLRTQLHPTQPGIGYTWALHKYEDDMSSEQHAQKELDAKPVPVVKWNDALYFTDGHHTLAGLDASGFWQTQINITISCDWSGLSVSAFWGAMERHGFAYLYRRNGGPNTLPEPFDPTLLPPYISFNAKESFSMRDDVWRSLAGASRKIKDKSCTGTDKCYRAFDRVCDSSTGGVISFFEYYWAYYWNAAYVDSAMWATDLTNADDFAKFNAAFTALSHPRPGDSLSSISDAYKAHKDVATLLVPLSRSANAAAYKLPAGFLTRSQLPGHVSGMVPIPTDDPTCPPILSCSP